MPLPKLDSTLVASLIPIIPSYKLVDITNQQFGRLTVVRCAGRHPVHRSAYWECLCECGNSIVSRGESLRSGKIISCGCSHKGHGRTHGRWGEPVYFVWAGMIQRCENPDHWYYKRWGGRGIKVCEQWHDFAVFIRDMGERPEGCSIERRNNNGDYTPENCYWGTQFDQDRNKRSNRWVTAQGVTQIRQDWATQTGIRTNTIKYRIAHGWTPEQAVGLETPPPRKK